MSKQTDFINKIAPGAQAAQSKSGVFASLTIAQACLESGWGKSAIGNNVFGVKASKGWTGKTQTVKTTEFYTKEQYQKMIKAGAKMKLIQVTAAGLHKVLIDLVFRDYATIAESLEDHAKLLMYPRYAPVRNAKDYTEACQQIKKCGYATDPKYSGSLLSLIKQYELFKFDTPQGTKTEPKPQIFKLGDKGDTIKMIQLNLTRVGYPCVVDGVFGEQTKAAVILLQTKNKVHADGLVGPMTIKILERGL